MSDRLAPLTALRAFEAAARHMSFAQAAAELNVTPAALSFQIKSLEDHLGAPVFRRLNRKIELTAEGAALMPGVVEGFEALNAAWGAARRRLDRGHLTVTTGPAFMASWLAPRVSRFVSAYPELKLRLMASLKLLSFHRDGIDLALRFGPLDEDEGYYSEILFEDWATPMMRPELAAQIHRPEDLLNHTLITRETNIAADAFHSWGAWFDAVGLPEVAVQGTDLSTPDAALNYAANGGGIVLGRLAIAEPYLRSGQLVMPLKQSIKRGIYCRLLCPAGYETDPNVMVFCNWIKEEVQSLTEFEKDRLFL